MYEELQHGIQTVVNSLFKNLKENSKADFLIFMRLFSMPFSVNIGNVPSELQL